MTCALAAAMATLLLLPSCVAPGGNDVVERVSPPPPSAPPAHVTPPNLRSWRLDGAPQQGGLVRGQVATETVALTLDGRNVPLGADGAFIIGFDRDAPPTMTLAEVKADGSLADHPLVIAPRAWRIERVDAPYRAGRSEPEFAALRPAELAAIAAARATRTDAAGWRQAFRWPAAGRQSGWFGSQRVYQGKPGSYHSGADVAVPTGTPVLAPADGVVVLAADHPFTLEGNLLMVDHGAGLGSAFLHLSRLNVHVGDHVRQGQRIALSGATGRATGPHLHWGLQWNGARLDPLLVAGPVPAG
ncbi:M23 family metallopeptidase [Sphingomonas rubra]|uniref:Murein DD-endopeptidase MepM and murein hydrolase activator NlpD, contain LysM domain n=1 Tax=Sphingomonas rubra TaxID=634430 RepID=A0A1I5T6Y7_9SPHN|nr:M23 family metallopeptidase [Sphingomonas rubra]SFP78800.1 Murein DD-endopeptidase MepM and murein hydrolase activator NlpD, contain LysM domain [Sphingomonas rubra]